MYWNVKFKLEIKFCAFNWLINELEIEFNSGNEKELFKAWSYDSNFPKDFHSMKHYLCGGSKLQVKNETSLLENLLMLISDTIFQINFWIIF